MNPNDFTISCADAAARVRLHAGISAHAPVMAEFLANMDRCPGNCPGTHMMKMAMEVARCADEDVILALLN